MSGHDTPRAAEETEVEDLTGLFALVVTRPVAVTMVFLAALVFGVVSYNQLPIELMPDISFPTITVRTSFEGAAPQEVEDQVSTSLEEALATLDGLVSLESRSRAGQSDVLLGFDWGTDMASSAQSVRESLQTTFLPEGTERPLILRYDPSLEPFLRVALSGGAEDASAAEQLFLLRQVADKELKRDLESLEGVAAVRVRGGLEREIRVEVREDWLAARGVRLDQVRTLLAGENVNLAGGSILEGDTEYLVRTLNEYKTVEELRTLEVRRADGVLVPLTDLAVIGEVPKERTVLSRLDGDEAVELEVFKEADANVVEVARKVKGTLFGEELGFSQDDVDAMDPGPMRDAMQGQLDAKSSLAAGLPDGMKLTLLDDQAAFIELAIGNLTSAVGLGGLFAVLVLYLFLRDARATGIIGVAIPVSVVVGFGPLYLWDVSLNLMSLGGLALGVGMLVDNAVVVLEAIQRHLEDGVPREEASVRGAREVAAAVVASTLTTVAVFAPIAFVEGVAGELFGDLAFAVVGSLLASLAVAVFLVPMLAALQLDVGSLGAVAWPGFRAAAWESVEGPVLGMKAFRQGTRDAAWRWVLLPYALLRFLLHAGVTLTLVGGWYLGGLALWVGSRVAGVVVWGVGTVANAAATVFQRGYAVVAGRYDAAMVRVVVLPGLVVLVATGLFFGSTQAAGWLGTELLPEVHQGRFTVRMALPVGTPLEETSRLVGMAEALVASHPEVATVYGNVGADDRADVGSDEGEHTARLRVQLTDGGSLAVREDRVMEDLRVALNRSFDGAEVEMQRPSLFSFRTPLEVVVYGRNLDILRESGERVAAELSAVPGLRDVRSSLVAGNPEVQISYDRERLVRFGLDTRTVATRVRDKVQGVEATEITRGAERLALRVQLRERERSSLADLRRLNVNPNVDPPVPLEAVASFKEAMGPSEIRRVDQQRAVVISANLEGFDMGSASEAVVAAMGRVGLPDGQRWTLGGQADEMSESLGSLQLALGLAVFLVYVIMASTFEHLLHPFVILFSVPLSVIGVVLGLLPLGVPLSVVVFIGLIVLAGVVVNNAIVLVDAINRLRADGLERLEAIREAGKLRLRPILITTSTTVLGLLPLALGVGAGAEVQRPLALTVIGGLTASTLLTLVVIPAVYALVTGSWRVLLPQRAHTAAPTAEASP